MITVIRGKLRKALFKWLNFKASRIYGSHIHPTVRLSRSTLVDKTNPRGIYIDEFTYLAGGGNFVCSRYEQMHEGRNSYWETLLYRGKCYNNVWSKYRR